ncbi:MAG: MBL fold metallo-hydrolase [Patescibacteria group bacterium]
MRVTKIGHSCLVVETGGIRIMTDPGRYSAAQNDVENIHAVIVTHEHPDHLDLDSLEKVRERNPMVRVICNKGVGAILHSAGVSCEIVEDGERVEIQGVPIEGFGKDHAFICDGADLVINTGYLINSILYHPGDALFVPPKKVIALALPVCAPWVKTSEVIEFAKQIKPRIVFPIHDGFLKFGGPFYATPERFLRPLDIHFEELLEGATLKVSTTEEQE